MAYRILYIEDQKASSMQDDLERQGYIVEVNDSDSFDNLFDVINSKEFDAYIFDFRLTANKGRLDAPAIAQSLRTKGNNYKSAPIILISNEDKLKEFDKDLTSQDLFDFAVSKRQFRDHIEKYTNRINSFISAYKTITKCQYSLDEVLGISKKEKNSFIDYRIEEKSKLDIFRNDPYAYCRFINISLIRGIGPLIGPDILAARLGVKSNTEDWNKLLSILDKFRYKGILSTAYKRWWMAGILEWWKDISDNISLRRTTVCERVKIINDKFKLKLEVATSPQFSTSKNLWTICMETKLGLDPNEGYIINKKEYAPWQEMEYISLYAALEQSKYRAFLSPSDKLEILDIEKNGSFSA